MPIDLSPALYGTVTGRLLAVVGDGPDADAAPDGMAVTGTVTFTPDITSILVSNGAPSPFTALPTPIECGLDADGYLVYPLPGVAGSKRGVSLLATTDPNMNPAAWTYVVSFKLQANGKPVSYPEFNVNIPAGGTIDLTTATPVPSSTGVYMAQGPRGEKGEQGFQGIQGLQGLQGIPGPAMDGESAYELAVLNGYTGTQQEWLDSLKGVPGATGPQGIQGPTGATGASAYQIWLNNGNTGTEAAYLASLKGADGAAGATGAKGDTGATGVTGATAVYVVAAMPATPVAGVLYIVTG